MSQVTKEKLIELYKNLPRDVADVYEGADTGEMLLEIGKKHALPIDMLGRLSYETGLVMVGASPAREFVTNIASALGVDRAEANEIAKDVNARLFAPIRESLKRIHNIRGTEPLFREEATTPFQPRPQTSAFIKKDEPAAIPVRKLDPLIPNPALAAKPPLGPQTSVPQMPPKPPMTQTQLIRPAAAPAQPAQAPITAPKQPPYQSVAKPETPTNSIGATPHADKTDYWKALRGETPAQVQAFTAQPAPATPENKLGDQNSGATYAAPKQPLSTQADLEKDIGAIMGPKFAQKIEPLNPPPIQPTAPIVSPEPARAPAAQTPRPALPQTPAAPPLQPPPAVKPKLTIPAYTHNSDPYREPVD